MYHKIAMTILIFFLIGLTGCGSQSVDDAEIVAYVNDLPIIVGEFKIYMSKNKVDVYRELYEKYRIEEVENFWKAEFDGVVPENICKERAMEDLTRIKVEQSLFLEEGITGKVDYLTFLNLLDEENKRRENAIEQNQPIYGPQHFEVNQYYNHLHSLQVIELKKIISNGTIEIESGPGDVEFETFYGDMINALITEAAVSIIEEAYESVSMN